MHVEDVSGAIDDRPWHGRWCSKALQVNTVLDKIAGKVADADLSHL